MDMDIARESGMGAWASGLTRQLIRAQLDATEAATDELSAVVHGGLQDLFADVPESPEARDALERTAHLLGTFSLVSGTLIRMTAGALGIEPSAVLGRLSSVMEAQGHPF